LRVFRCRNSFRSTTIQKGTQNVTCLPANDEVLHRGQGPQEQVQVEVPKIYTIVQCMQVEADGRLRYRIKSDKIERLVDLGLVEHGDHLVVKDILRKTEQASQNVKRITINTN
jgi:hypothetical protein